MTATPGSAELVPLGEIVATHGLSGWLKLNLFNSRSTVLANTRHLVVVDQAGVCTPYELEASQAHKHQLLIKLKTIDHISQAERWVGARLCLEQTQLPAPASGEYYIYQAIGLEVFDQHNQRVGVVTRTLSTGGGELYVVQGPEKEHLIPAVKEIIEKVDFNAGRMIINPPEGLLDL